MEFFAITLANLIWILYCSTEGVKDGLFAHYKNSSKKSCNLDSKILFTTQRILVLFATGGLLIWSLNFWSVPFIIGQYFMYKYFHKISYEITLKKINNKVEQKEIEKPTKLKEKAPMMLGVALQIITYIYII